MTLRDKLKFWLALNNYIEMIVHDTSLLSLPNAMEDSLDYLKALGGTEQRNLPSGYTELTYIESTGTQWINTGVTINEDSKVDILYSMTSIISNPEMPFGTRLTGDASDAKSGMFRTHGSRTNRIAFGNGAETNITVTGYNSSNTDYNLVIDKNGAVINGTTVATFPTSTITNVYPMYIFACNTSGTASFLAAIKLYSFKLYDNNTLVRNLIPAKRNSDNVVGMYDTVTDTFFTNQGTGTFTAGPTAVPTPDTPMDIISNNGVLKVNLNLYWTEYNGYELLQTDGITPKSNSGVNVSGMIDCRTIKSFKITTTSPQGSFRIFKYRADNTYIDANSIASIGDIITLEDNVGFFRIQYNFTNSGTGTENVLIYNSAYDLNSIYTDGTVETIKDSLNNTATAEMLLKVGNYQDAQSIIDGVVTRNLRVVVFDGTENWAVNSMISHHFTCKLPNQFDSSIAYKPTYCTHFLSDSGVDDNTCKLQYRLFSIRYDAANENINTFKQFLANQYAAGTPVIVIYPLKTPTTESVSGQALQVTEGNNIAEITQASLDNLELEAKYNSVP